MSSHLTPMGGRMRIPNGVMILPERLYVGSLGPPVVFVLKDTLTDDACTLVVRSDFGGFAGVPAVFSEFPRPVSQRCSSSALHC